MRLALLLIAITGIAAAIGYGGLRLHAGFQPTEFEFEEVDLPARYPGALPPVQMRISVLSTGQMHSDKAFAYRGGQFGESQISAMDALLIQHPKGDFLIDTGFGTQVAEHFKTTPFLMQALSSFEATVPVIKRFEEEEYSLDNLAGIILTHAHWDHVSGIPDLPQVPVWITQAELDYIQGDDPHTALIRSFGNLDYLVYAFDDGPYMGYPRSLDVYRDGSLVLVPIGGHTPGSIGAFISLPDDTRIMMVGDIVWAKEAIEIPAERPAIAADMVDIDQKKVRQAIGHLHQLHNAFPDQIMVPAHDRRVFEQLAEFPVAPPPPPVFVDDSDDDD